MISLQNAQYFFEDYIKTTSTSFIALPQSGSARKNFIGEAVSKKYVVTYNENLLENEAFFYFSEVFQKLQLNTPEIYHINQDRTLYIQEYLGEETFSEIISQEGESQYVKALAKKTLEQLWNLQQNTQNKIDYTKTFEYERYDDLPIVHDLYYFKNFVADVLELHYHKSSLLKEFKKIAEKITHLSPQSLMIRDFQARNIMVKEKNVYFIDYQAAMLGPSMYDVVSFLYQAKANFSEEFKKEMLAYYFSFYESEEVKKQLKESLKYCKLIRFLQVLGAYGFRGLIQRKVHFMASIEQGIKNLVEFAENEPEMNIYPELKGLISQLHSENTQQKIQNLINLNQNP